MDDIAVAPWFSFAADLMLAAAALYVTGQALRGWHKEAQAEKLAPGPDRDAMINDAKTFYALASLSKVWVLFLILFGTLIKLGVNIASPPWG